MLAGHTWKNKAQMILRMERTWTSTGLENAYNTLDGGRATEARH